MICYTNLRDIETRTRVKHNRPLETLRQDYGGTGRVPPHPVLGGRIPGISLAHGPKYNGDSKKKTLDPTQLDTAYSRRLSLSTPLWYMSCNVYWARTIAHVVSCHQGKLFVISLVFDPIYPIHNPSSRTVPMLLLRYYYLNPTNQATTRP